MRDRPAAGGLQVRPGGTTRSFPPLCSSRNRTRPLLHGRHFKLSQLRHKYDEEGTVDLTKLRAVSAPDGDVTSYR